MPDHEEAVSVQIVSEPDGDPVGTVLFDRYQLKEVIHEQPEATLCTALDLKSKELVLIERLNVSISQQQELLARLAKEAMSLEHENILKLLACEISAGGKPHLVWEYIDFIGLNQLVDAGGFICEEAELFDTVVQTCHGVQFAHAAGISHGYLHPRNIYLAEVDGRIVVKITNFGYAYLQQALLCDQSAVLKPGQLTTQADVYQLAVLTFFLATGEPPAKDATLDGIFNRLFSVKIHFDALRDMRPELSGLDDLIQLLEDAIDPDESRRVKSVQEFEDGLIDWIEAAKTACATRSDVAEKIADGQLQSGEPAQAEEKRKSTNNLRTTLRQLVNLRNNQSTKEETAVMRLTNLAAAKGPRQSPLSSMARLAGIGLTVGFLVSAILYATLVKPDESRRAWLNASANFATLLGKNEESSDESIADIPAVSDRTAQSSITPKRPIVAPSPPKSERPSATQKAPNRVPPFDHNKLPDLYRKDFSSTNNQLKRIFRVEYREFNEDWIQKP